MVELDADCESNGAVLEVAVTTKVYAPTGALAEGVIVNACVAVPLAASVSDPETGEHVGSLTGLLPEKTWQLIVSPSAKALAEVKVAVRAAGLKGSEVL